MNRKTISTFALVAAFSAAALTPATASAQDGVRREQHERRLYDRSHRDYHSWSSDEDRLYREYLTQRHRNYRALSRLNQKQQREYWRWRHEHGSQR